MTNLLHKSFDRKTWVRIQRANPDAPTPSYGGSVQCDCGHSASMDHVDGTGKCTAPGCKCEQMKEYRP